MAVTAEVATFCEFIRLQEYLGEYERAAKVAAAGESVAMMPIDARQKYFVIYEAIAAEIGQLSADQAGQISRFYTLLKIAIDTARPASLFDATLQNLRFMHGLTREILRLGDVIIQFPAAPLTHQMISNDR